VNFAPAVAINFDPAVAINFDPAVAMIFDPAVAMIFDPASNNKLDHQRHSTSMSRFFDPCGAEDFARFFDPSEQTLR
jgi:hypothetical protein